MSINVTNILLRHHHINIPSGSDKAGPEALATVAMNLSHYGKSLSVEAYNALSKLSPTALADWWQETEKELKAITGDDLKIGDFVVYKNFPAEVLSKSEADYWLPQILMYWGFPNEWFTEEVKPREKMSEQPKTLVLKLAKANTTKEILNSYLRSPARWKEHELADVLFLSSSLPFNLGSLAFKENLVSLATHLMNKGESITVSTATDVLRLAAGLSDGDVSLREKVKFKSFKKQTRKFLLSSLEKCNNIDEDFARRPELWKRLVHQLHPGDWSRQYPRTVKAMNDLYKDRLVTYNAVVERMLREKNEDVLGLLSSRAGDFRRRLFHLIHLFGKKAVTAFTQDRVLGQLTTYQLVSTRTLVETYNERFQRVFPPRGNWNKLQFGEVRHIDPQHVTALSKKLGKALAHRVPHVKVLDPATQNIKLPNNGETGEFTRGTKFPIPENVQFIRTASYWEAKGHGNIWFDNGWNFFDANWKSVGAISWRSPKYTNGSAAFSGDPTNSKDVKGRACQLIDLYPEKLKQQGVRYAVWNVLCFSHIPFAQATEVFAALQWGEDAQKGKLFDPARNQLAFPLTGDQHTKFVCVLDLETREMIYVDANLKASVSAADENGAILEKTMPAFMEYLKSLPSVHDLFRESVRKSAETQILYSDKDAELKGETAYVFRPENKESKFKTLDLNKILE